MKKVDFNCDLGESFGTYKMGYDEQLMSSISSANIACGFHAGDPMWMSKTVNIAEQNGVAIGAHPGFPDLMGFGRREMKLTPEEIKNYVIYQIGALQAFTTKKRLQHVKPHGALYNMGAVDEQIARAVVDGIRDVDADIILVGLAGSAWIKAGQQANLRVASEVFADRLLNPDGTLVPRSISTAVITNVEEVVSRSLKMITQEKAVASNGTEIHIKADTICLHSDTPGAIALAKRLRQEFKAAGIEVVPMSNFL